MIATGLLLVPGVAAAQSFEALAEKATPVKRLDDVVWAFTAACDRGDELHQRQCRLIRDKRVAELAGATLLVDGDTAALELGTWNPKKRSMPVTVRACIRCGGVEVEGKTWHLIGAGAAPRFEGGKLRPKVLVDTTRMFDNDAAATAWTKSLANARVQYVVKLPARPWTAGGKRGLAFEVLGYRVASPCDGAVVAANPPAQPVAPDKRACAGAPVAADPPPEGVPEQLPDALTGTMIREAMRPVIDAANACYQRYRVSGKAKLVMVIAGDGRIVEYRQEGELLGTPMATCIDTAAKKVTFPKTRKPRTKVGFPVVVR